ncbi:unnamed protein product [Boreogadus saida]
MLYLLGIIIGIIFIIMCFSNALKPGKGKSDNSVNSRKRDLNEEDLHLLAKILSLGLVDADPNYLQHLKYFRDLHGGST